jgi:hypothetical protein
MLYQKLIIAGCSFSACSSSVEEANLNPCHWPQFLCKMLGSTQLVNLGISGAGVQSTSNNLINFCEHDYIDPAQTLVVFNISQLHRWDLMCTTNHPDSLSTVFSWNTILNHNWILSEQFKMHNKSHYMHQLAMNMGVDQQIKLNCLSLIGLMSYLEQKGLQYYFVMLDDSLHDKDTPEFFKKFLSTKLDHLVTVQNFYSLKEFARSTRNICNDNFHPDAQGYKIIAEHMFERITQSKQSNS